MKRKICFMIVFLTVISFNSFGMDDLEGLLMSDESNLEAELLREEKAKGDIVTGEVRELRGQAVMKNDEEEVWKQIFKGMEISEGSTIVTMENSQVKIELLDGSIVDLRPKTQAYFKTLRQNPDQKELTETGIKLFMGKIYSNVKKIVDTGSKYKVETSSATAGVRGTKFTVSVDDLGETQTEVYEGVVEFFSNQSPDNLIQVMANERAKISSNGRLSPKETHNNAPPEDIEVTEKSGDVTQEEKLDVDEKEEVSEDETKDKKGGSKTGYGVKMEAGSKVVNDNSYGTLEINPNFTNIFGTPIGLGLKITVLQGQEGEDKVTKYGPGASDDWYDALSLRWAEYDGKVVGLRYGELGAINYGHGLLMENYTTFGAKARLTLKNNRIYGFAPLKESSNGERDHLYGARYERRVYKGLFSGVTYIQDSDENIDDLEGFPTQAVGVDTFYELFRILIPYAEYNQFLDYGNGYEAGIRGGVSFFNYKLAYRGIGEEFTPTLYDQFYESQKTEIDLESELYNEAYSGYLGELGLNLFSLVDLSARYEDYPDKDLKRIKGDLSIARMSFLPGMWSRIQGGATYKQLDVDFDDFEWMDEENASVYGYIVYPASGSVDVRIEYIKEPGKEEYTTFRTIISF
ncbi:MAG: FecR family protein [Fusobacteriota bacterium]